MGFITGASDSFLQCTGYEYRDIFHKHIADILLTGVLAQLHKTIFIPKFGKAVGKEKARLRNFLKNHMSKIRCTISTPNGLHKVFVCVEEINREELCVTFTCCRNADLTVGATVQDIIPPLLRDCPVETSPTLTADNVGIIAMDLYGSTNYIDQVGVHPYVSSQKTLFDELQRHLEVDLFPLVQLHEVLNDSFVLTVNSPWWCQSRVQNLRPFLILVARYLTWHLNDICDKYYKGKIYIRCGVAQGSIVANITGRHFRMYGQCLNVACRLESLCEQKCVHALDESSPTSHRLKGFAKPVTTSQICAQYCPMVEEICEMVGRPGFMANDKRSSFTRSKNVYTIREPPHVNVVRKSLGHHNSEDTIRSSMSSMLSLASIPRISE